MRTIDADRRRLELADAVWRIILRDGLDAASVRNVAAEAGLSAGSVRHFFNSQAELHVFAMEALADRVRERVERASRKADVRARIEAILRELLPMTERSAVEFAAWLHFVLRSAVDPRLAEVSRRMFDDVRRLLVDLLTGARELGLTSPELDVRAAAAELNALIDGLTLDVITAPHLVSRARAGAVLHRWLEGVLR